MGRKSKRHGQRSAPRQEPAPAGGRVRWWLWIAPALVLWVGGELWWFGRRAPEPPPVPAGISDPAMVRSIGSRRAAVEAAPRSGEAWGQLATVLLHAQMVAPSDFAFEQAGRFAPQDPRWPYLRGMLQREIEVEAAITHFREAARLAGDRPDAPRLRLAELLLERGRWEEAEGEFERLVAAVPGHAPAVLGLARIRLAQDRVADAAALLTRCVDHPSTARIAHSLLAQVQRRLGAEAAAEALARALRRLPPDRAWPDPYWQQALEHRAGKAAWIAQAQGLIDAGLLDDAFRTLNRVANDYPEDDESRYLLGWILNRQGRGRDAEVSLREHLRLAPNSPKGFAQLAVALLAQERHAEAVDVLQRGLRLKPTWAELHFNLGYACARLDRKDEAVAHFRDCVRLDPNYVEAYITLADLLSQRGESAEARRILQQALALDPDDERARFLEQRIPSAP